MPELTKRQSEVLRLIQSAIEKTGAPPTRAEIAEQMGFHSANAAEDHLRALARRGFIEITPHTSRGIRILKKTSIPLVKKLASEELIFEPDNIEDTYDINNSIFKYPIHYFFRMPNDGMRDAACIVKGDLLAINTSLALTPKANQLVIARVQGDEAVVARFGGSLAMAVEGVVVGVLRGYG